MSPHPRRALQAVQGALSLLILILLIAALPVVLYRFAGSPLPHSIPSWQQVSAALRQQDNGSLFLAAVRDLGWLAWALFTASTLVEAACLLTGRATPRALSSSPLQHLARALLTSAVIGFTGPAALAAPAPMAAPPAAAHVTPPPAAAQPAELTAAFHASPGHAQLRAVTVRPGDCLWTIAARHLGSGHRYEQLVQLNLGRTMPGGQKFTDPDVIMPGWVLHLPPGPHTSSARLAVTHSRTDNHVHDGHPGAAGHYARPHNAAAAAPPPPAPSAESPPAGPAEPRPAVQPQSSGLNALQPQASAPAASAVGQHEPPALAIFAAGLLIGGVAATVGQLRHRQRQNRRPGRRIAMPAGQAAQHAEHHMQDLPDSPAPGVLRATMATLARSLRGTGLPLPPIAALHLSASAVDILLTSPAEPPAPFRPAPGRQDMCWRIDHAELAGPSAAASPGDLLPALATAGTIAGGVLLIDLEAPGVTTVDGPPALVDQMLHTLATELATSIWPGTYDLLVCGFPGLPAAHRAQACATLDDAISMLERRARELAASEDPTSSRQARLADPGSPEATLTLLVSRNAPDLAQMGRLLDAARPASGVCAVVPGDLVLPDGREAGASLQMDEDPDQPGQVTASVHPYGLSVTPLLLTASQFDGISDVLAATQRDDVAAGEPPYPSAPGPPPEVPERQEPPAEAAETGARVRIIILGPFTITGSQEALQPKHAELVLGLALAGPAGLPMDSLRTRLGASEDQPKPADSLRQIITRTRRRLGDGPDGRPYILYDNGQYRLHPAARLDWDQFRQLAVAGREDRDVRLLTAALRLVTGRPLDNVYHWWIDPVVYEDIRAEVVDTASLLAELSLAAGDPPAAARAARCGLGADPAAEQLWRALMSAEDAAGNTAGIYEAWQRCLEVIREVAADGEPHELTTRLYCQLTRRQDAAARR